MGEEEGSEEDGVPPALLQATVGAQNVKSGGENEKGRKGRRTKR